VSQKGPSGSTPSFGGNSGAQALYGGASAATGAGMKAYQNSQNAINPDSGTATAGSDASDAGSGGVVAAKGGRVPALVSPGEIYLSPKAVQQVRNGADPMHVGEKIPGKPKVGGAKNSYANDIVSKDLQAGGIVVPRSETKSKHPEKNSKDFVSKVMAKRKGK
jgi:hypothetical protein